MSETNDWNKNVIADFRATGGKPGGPFEGAPILLLHTTGAKSGVERVNPLMYQQVGDDVAVFASKAGATTNPDWYHNLRATARATIEIGADHYDVDARVANGDERRSIWETQKERYRGFAEYEKTANRDIPVVILERALVTAAAPPPTVNVVRNDERSRDDILVDGELAGHSDYRIEGNQQIFVHTEISPDHRGEDLAAQLVRTTLDGAW